MDVQIIKGNKIIYSCTLAFDEEYLSQEKLIKGVMDCLLGDFTILVDGEEYELPVSQLNNVWDFNGLFTPTALPVIIDDID